MKKSLLALVLVASTAFAAAPTPPGPTGPPGKPAPSAATAPVTRAEFNALKVEVARLKASLATAHRSTNAVPTRPTPKTPVSPK